MARCLIVACGCRGRLLADELGARAHVVRGTTRTEAHVAAIQAVAAEAIVADPDRIGTLSGALEHVGVACILLGSAGGDPDQLADLHGTRLEMLLHRILDTTIRGVVYEAAGTVDPAVLARGAEVVRRACETSRIPFALLEREPSDGYPEWATAAADAVDRVLTRS